MPFPKQYRRENIMLLPCEVAVRNLLPSIRASIAKELMTRHGLRQAKVAIMLGISQPAVSMYSRRARGKALGLEKDKDIKNLIARLADAIARGQLSQRDFVLSFCEICRKARAKRLLCGIHKNMDSSFNVESCSFCKDESLKCF